MRVAKQHDFGEVKGYEIGLSKIGTPKMMSYFYIFDGVIIDTAFKHMRKEVLEITRGKKIDKLLLTHFHEDHTGNSAALKRMHNIDVFCNELSREKLKESFKIFPYQKVFFGKSEPLQATPCPDEIKTENYRFIPIHTPGHSKDHTVYLVPEKGYLFSGDMYLADRVKYFRSDEKIKDQIESLKKILNYDFEALFCGHNPKPHNGKQGLRNKLQFLEEKYGEIKELWIKGNNRKEIMKKLNYKEVYDIKLISFGNISMENMVKSVIESL